MITATIPCPAHQKSTRFNQTALRRALILRAQGDILFAHADELERYRRACSASENPDGAEAWKRLANHTRTEAEAFHSRANLIESHAK
ncbi:hypothetical protein [Acetobacter pasteurianus]|uniref:hypothetical protein n=1 Tax=Acetobacter pasteurianus TaxID=438 RepID=UPI00286C0AB8|nr:hypothetical protein [Acetobacter pasteurianus]WKC16718.1 hypothetical protein FCN51_15825 [Acetobacter pasteurianus]